VEGAVDFALELGGGGGVGERIGLVGGLRGGVAILGRHGEIVGRGSGCDGRKVVVGSR
jgi:hypothetical protein